MCASGCQPCIQHLTYAACSTRFAVADTTPIRSCQHSCSRSPAHVDLLPLSCATRYSHTGRLCIAHIAAQPSPPALAPLAAGPLQTSLMASVALSMDFSSDDDDLRTPSAGTSIIAAPRDEPPISTVKETLTRTRPPSRQAGEALANQSLKRRLPFGSPAATSADGSVATCQICGRTSQVFHPALQHKREKHGDIREQTCARCHRIACISLPWCRNTSCQPYLQVAGHAVGHLREENERHQNPRQCASPPQLRGLRQDPG